jgi:hypothetical protein
VMYKIITGKNPNCGPNFFANICSFIIFYHL